MKRFLCTLALLVTARPSIGRAEAGSSAKYDRVDLIDMKTTAPQAYASFEAGQQAFEQHQYERAASLFGQASAGARDSALASRMQSKALRLIGRRQEAIAAARKAAGNQGSAEDLRAYVAALVDGGPAPTPEELAYAILLAQRAEKQDPAPGYAAHCDIARRLRDRAMLAECSEKLQAIAPRGEGTKRALAAQAALAPSGWRVFAWIALGLVCLLTLAHAAFGRARRSAALAATLLALVGIAAPGFARAEDVDPMPGHFPINDQDPESAIPSEVERNKAPLDFGYFLMALSDKAEAAQQRGDGPAVVKYYRALAKAVPDRSVGFSKLCSAYEAIGDGANAIEACRAALGLGGVTLEDSIHFVRLLLHKDESLSSTEIEDVDAVVQNLAASANTAAAADQLACELGVRLQDAKRLESCTARLSKSAPNAPETISFEWALSILRNDRAAAERLFERAKTAAFDRETLQRMQQATEHVGGAAWQRALRDPRVTIGAGAVLVAIALAFWRRNQLRARHA